jgi:hypothetical protein
LGLRRHRNEVGRDPKDWTFAYLIWNKKMGFNAYSEIPTPHKIRDVIEEIDWAMKTADEIHFNTDGFSPLRSHPEKGATLKPGYRPTPAYGFTNYEYARILEKHVGKTTFWHYEWEGGIPVTWDE